MFRAVTPPIIRSTYNCNYSIWHWSNRLWYFPLWWSWNGSSNFTTIAEGSRDGLTSARCRNYSYMCSWWWVELPPETCSAVYSNIINCIQSHLVGQLLTLTHDARTHKHKIQIFHILQLIVMCHHLHCLWLPWDSHYFSFYHIHLHFTAPSNFS